MIEIRLSPILAGPRSKRHRIFEMSGPAPYWLRGTVTGFAVCVFVYCLWIGKIGGLRGIGRVATRAKDPGTYWTRMSILAAMIGFMLYGWFR